MKTKVNANKELNVKYVYIILAAIAVLLSGFFADRWDQLKLPTENQISDYADKVIISEVMSDNASCFVLGDGTYPDWVEILNVSGETIDLNGFELMKGKHQTCVIPSAVLEDGETVLILCDKGGSLFHAPFHVSTAGDTLMLMDPRGCLVQVLEVPPLSANESYAYMDGEYATTFEPTPDMSNLAENYRGPAVASAKMSADSVVINEVMLKSATYMGGCDYIELYNASRKAVSLKDWYLSDKETNLRNYCLPDISIRPGDYYVITCGTEDGTPFRLNADGETLFLMNADGVLTDRVDCPALSADRSYSRTEDGNFTTKLQPTPGYENSCEGAQKLDAELRAMNRTGVIFSEVLTSSADDSYDWVEIRNTTSGDVNLSGWGLSDKATTPRKWQFPSGTVLRADSCMRVFLSGLDGKQNGELHTGFSLSLDTSETLVLSTADGTVIDRVSFPTQYTGVPYGRLDGKDGFYYLTQATPGMVNNVNGYPNRMKPVSFTVEGGIFHIGDSVTVELSSSDGGDIYYTLDCSDPDPANFGGRTFEAGRDDVNNHTVTYRYSGPITFSDNTVVRAVCVKDGLMTSVINTQSYLFIGDQTLQVVSLVTSPENLWDYNTGIYVSGPNAEEEFPYGKDGEGANFWMDWTRSGNVELYDTDSAKILNQGVDLKLHGNYSRAYREKAFKIYASGEYGSNRFFGKLFPNRDYTEYKSFLLRAGGQDYQWTHFRDSVLQTLADGTSVMHQDTNAVALYLNGTYWGQYNMREHITPYSVCQWEGWDDKVADSMDMLSDYYVLVHGSRSEFMKLREWIEENGIDTDEKLAYVGQFIDLENFKEFIAIQIFVSDEDYQNTKMYKSKLTDNKWRFILFDLDMTFRRDINSVGRFLKPGAMGKNQGSCNFLFIALMQNPTWRAEFLKYFSEQMRTVFSTESIIAKTDAWLNIISTENEKSLARWDITQKDYNSYVNEFKEFARTRPGRILYFFAGKDNNYDRVMTDAELEYYFGDLIDQIPMLDAKFNEVSP